MTGQPFDTLEPAPSSVGLSQGCAEGADSNVDEAHRKIYLSGPMTGYPEFNYPAFNHATDALRRLGHFVISPVECSEHLDGTEAEWVDYLRADIPELVQCDTLVLLDGWHRSKGARLEHHIALELGMTVLTLVEALA